MRLFYFLILVSVFAVACEDRDEAEDFDTWVRIHTGIARDLKGMALTKDGGCVVANVYDTQSTILTFSPNGSLINQLDLRKYTSEVVLCMTTRTAGDVVAAGFAGGNLNFYIVNIAPNGELVKETSVDLSINPTAILESYDGGVLICGRTSNHAVMLKFNSDLEFAWTQIIGDTMFSEALGMATLSRGRVAVVGNNHFFGSLTIVDSTGRIESALRMEASFYDMEIVASKSDEIFVAGYFDQNRMLMKFDQEFNLVYSSTVDYHDNLVIKSLCLGRNNLPTLVGTRASNTSTRNDIWIAQYSASGVMTWSEYYLSSAAENGIAINSIGAGFLVLGELLEYNGVYHDLILMRVDQNGEL